jgi:hypothetical protein
MIASMAKVFTFLLSTCQTDRRRLAGTRILDKNASREIKRVDVAAHQRI